MIHTPTHCRFTRSIHQVQHQTNVSPDLPPPHLDEPHHPFSLVNNTNTDYFWPILTSSGISIEPGNPGYPLGVAILA